MSSPWHGDLCQESVFGALPRKESSQMRTKAKSAEPQTNANTVLKSSTIRPTANRQSKLASIQEATHSKLDSGIDTGSSVNTVQSDEVTKEQVDNNY